MKVVAEQLVVLVLELVEVEELNLMELGTCRRRGQQPDLLVLHLVLDQVVMIHSCKSGNYI